jgi:hypothetical protein
MEKKKRLLRWVGERKPTKIDAGVQEEIAKLLAPISESYLRRLVLELDVPLDPLVEGVRQDNWENLRRTLEALAGVYETGDPSVRKACRKQVIQAKDHARLAARKADPERRAMKEEMAEWMLVWLENPGVFTVWARLRWLGLSEEARRR